MYPINLYLRKIRVGKREGDIYAARGCVKVGWTETHVPLRGRELRYKHESAESRRPLGQVPVSPCADAGRMREREKEACAWMRECVNGRAGGEGDESL